MKQTTRPGWMFWVLAPFFVLSIIVITFLALVQGEHLHIIIALVLDMLCVFGFLGFLNPIRFRWALRAAGFIVFLIYIAYLIYMLVESKGQLTWSNRKSDTNVLNAILGLCCFGYPGIKLAITGRLPFFLKQS